jgi:hypothetical protein
VIADAPALPYHPGHIRSPEVLVLARVICASVLLLGSAHAQELKMKFAGSHPPAPEVLSLIQQYQAASTNFPSIAARDEKRRPLMSPGYFYLGLDGVPIGFDGLGARHTRNDLKFEGQAFYDIVLHQYENTAIVTYKTHNKGMDKGKPFSQHSASALVMGRTAEGWRVVADVLGREIGAPEAPAATK